jgi:very-short-patch-repair endonuclease
MSCSTTRKILCGNIKCSTCYSRSFATHPKSEFWSSKNELEPHEVLKSSNKKYLFDCKECGHELEMMVKNVSGGQWCKYCKGGGICTSDKCDMCYKRSFASHPMAVCWSNKNKINPREVLKGSDKRFWFDCKDCGHDFDCRLFSVVKDKQCVYCSNQKLCNDTQCNNCYTKSCASHEMNTAWSSKNDLFPNNVFLQSNKKIIFNCLKCKHEYETTPNHYYNRNGSCPYCDNKKLCDNDCEQCFNKSFASHPLVTCWSNKNKINPRNIFKGSENKGIFNCNMCNSEFESKMYNVLTGYWCPYCKNKSEGKLLEFIKSNYKDYKTQVRFDWCRYSQTNNIMPFDFGLIDKKILIELDGEQHFSQVSNWDTPESTQSKDTEKIRNSIQNGYSIIHIYQKEVWNDIYNWKDILTKVINYLEKKKESICILISCVDKYQNHITKLDNMIKYKVINPKNLEL